MDMFQSYYGNAIRKHAKLRSSIVEELRKSIITVLSH